MKKVKGFSYDVFKEKRVIDHIDKQPNKSQYIWDLVRKDIDNEKNKIENMVFNCIEKYLQNNDIKIKGKQKKNISVSEVSELINIGR